MNSVYDVWTSPYGFLHSEIRGSMDICSSPRLIAAYHVLRRLPVPRHSPCALLSLTMRYITFSFSELSYARIFVVTSTNIVVYPNITIHGFYITLSHSQFSLFNFQGAFMGFLFLLEKDWWAQVDSNHRPHAYQACALTT